VSDPLLYTPHGCVLYLDLRKPDGEYLRDYSGHGNHGVIHGARLEHRHPLWGLYFDGKDSHVEVPKTPAITPTTALTVEVLLRQESVRDADHRMNPVNIEDVRKGYMIRTGAGVPYFWIGDGTTWHYVYAPSPISLHEWHHIVGTYDGSVQRLYVDAVEVASLKWSGTIAYGVSDLWIGDCEKFSPRVFHGYILLVRIYNRALSGEEIKRCFESIQQRILRRVVGHVL